MRELLDRINGEDDEKFPSLLSIVLGITTHTLTHIQTIDEHDNVCEQCASILSGQAESMFLWCVTCNHLQCWRRRFLSCLDLYFIYIKSINDDVILFSFFFISGWRKRAIVCGWFYWCYYIIEFSYLYNASMSFLFYGSSSPLSISHSLALHCYLIINNNGDCAENSNL